MTRARLTAGLFVGALVLGLATAIVQSHNRAEGARLDDLREECLLIEAVDGSTRARILALDHGPLQPALPVQSTKLGARP